MGKIAPLAALPVPQAPTAVQSHGNQAMPASLRILDTGVPFDGALDLMSEDLDIGRKLALLRQDMAGFSGTSMLSNLDWRGGNGLFTLP